VDSVATLEVGRDDLRRARLVTEPLPELAPGEALLRVERFGLSATGAFTTWSRPGRGPDHRLASPWRERLAAAPAHERGAGEKVGAEHEAAVERGDRDPVVAGRGVVLRRCGLQQRMVRLAGAVERLRLVVGGLVGVADPIAVRVDGDAVDPLD
jgi:hypothetical protein